MPLTQLLRSKMQVEDEELMTLQTREQRTEKDGKKTCAKIILVFFANV